MKKLLTVFILLLTLSSSFAGHISGDKCFGSITRILIYSDNWRESNGTDVLGVIFVGTTGIKIKNDQHGKEMLSLIYVIRSEGNAASVYYTNNFIDWIDY